MPSSSTSIRVFLVALAGTLLLPLVLFELVLAFPALRQSLGPWVTYLSSAGIMALAWWALSREKLPLAAIGWTLPRFLQAVVGILVGWALWGAVLMGLRLLRPEAQWHIGITSPRSIITYWLFVGLGEEMIFRGYIFIWLARFFQARGKHGVVWGMILSSLLFALAHIPQRILVLQMAPWDRAMLLSLGMVFLLGLYQAWIFYRSGNIFWAGFVHGGGDAPLLSFGAQDPVTGIGSMVVFLFLTEVLRRRFGGMSVARSRIINPS